jgi:TonB-linked SusC/RagA family outer membrane protein
MNRKLLSLFKTNTLRKIIITAFICGCSISLYSQGKITGKVSDESGTPIAGASVVIKGTNVGVSTGIDGSYSVSTTGADNVLVFSLLGFVTQETGINGRTVINITLANEAENLEEVVVVGFGKQKKQSVTGAITTISPREMRVPSSNLSNAFAGKLAGVVAVQRTGEPGADGASFWIRGISTFSGATNPLIFIDGVEASTGDMNALSPEVIENFSVLKDATATALYGARGANGVILVNTRQGAKNERAKINIRFEGQMTQPTKTLKLADGVTFMETYNEAEITRGKPAVFGEDKISGTRRNLNPYIYPNVDWYDVLFNDWAYNQTANINVTGGGNRVTYFMNATLNNDNGMLKNDPLNKFDNNISLQRYSMQGNIAADLTSTTKATVRLNSQILNYSGSYLSTADIYSYMFISPSVLFPPYFPQQPGVDNIMFGNLGNGPIPWGGANLYRNAYAEMVRGYQNRSENTNTVSFELEQNLKMITEGLRIKGLISFKNWTRTRISRYFTPFFYESSELAADAQNHVWEVEGRKYGISDPLLKGTTALTFGQENTGDRLMNIQLSADYARTFADRHNVGAMLVYLQRDYNSNAPGDYYTALPVRNQGIAGRVTYDYDGRYLAEANFGYNGSENFAKGNRFGFFPSFAVGYNISNETFWKPIRHIVSNLKLRGSYGLVGNATISTDIGDRFPYLTLVNMYGRSFTFGDDWQTTMQGGAISRYGTEGATWETGAKLNGGIDLQILRSLDLIVDIYREERSGIFMRYRTTPIESGMSRDLVPYANLGKVRNQGVDVSLNWNKMFLDNQLAINVRGTFTYSKNTLLDRDEPLNTPDYMSEIGKPLNRNMGLIAIGLFKSPEEIDSSPRQDFGDYSIGDIKYADLNGDNVIDGNDRTQIGDPTVPQIVWGAGFSAAYKGFDLSLFFQGAAKTSILMGDIHPFNSEYSQLYQSIADDHWSADNPNPNAKYPRLIAQTSRGAHNNHQQSTYWLRNGAFFRLKNVEIGYTYKFARLYLSGQNVFTASDFDLWDPELGGVDGGNGYSSAQGRGLKYPTLRVFSLGLQLQF